MDPDYDWLRSEPPGTGQFADLLSVARERQAAGDFRTAATAYDRAYGLNPTHPEVIQERQAILERLSVRDHGLYFRYIPAGTFLMGSESGDPDEQPVHVVELDDFWLTETPVSWTDYCRLRGWRPPPEGAPWVGGSEIYFTNQMRRQYCENDTTRAQDPIVHTPEGIRQLMSLPEKRHGEVELRDPDGPWGWDQKPMIAIDWNDAVAFAELLTRTRVNSGLPKVLLSILTTRKTKPSADAKVSYGLPTEAEWEKAARGGLHNCQYPWGNDPPTSDCCDFNRWDPFWIKPSRSLPPNGYGLYGMSGGVWEWTADRYDAVYYIESPHLNPSGPKQLGEERASSQPLPNNQKEDERVLRGGSWTDPAEVVTVSFRMSRDPQKGSAPNIGFRLVRRMVP